MIKYVFVVKNNIGENYKAFNNEQDASKYAYTKQNEINKSNSYIGKVKVSIEVMAL